ncbi:diguanylate cyclase [Sulfuricurvum sp. IAE1]|uniref:GGDEF domain-containing response regulator n=1 Tax=Sulfuricurvum sp. IAE1 TaxID=2546102 RepID=UPI00104382AF|nr:diguanylate cyclase [Sulfuricurvum sp. IAE1]TDA67342.1 diguanylate cyclase [Sulfuricurvum sp. IAE1]
MSMINKKATILIVDDMSTNISVLYDLLCDDYEIQAATNGEDALAIAQSAERPDVILLDIEMPGMDGYAVCKALKNLPQTKEIPIIFVTARNSPEDEEHGFNLGAVDYISKPFYPAIVRVRVKTIVDMKLKNDLLEELSMVDGLTHIANRRAFDETYLKRFRDSERENRALSVMMIDVDFFKNYNDHYGHGKGDECLIRIAAALNAVLKRPGDIVARYGGEEFVVLLESIDYEGNETVAHHLLEAVRRLQIPHEYSSAAEFVTISIGIAVKTGKTTPETLLKHADEALYRAKNEGRNRYVYYAESVPPLS